MITTQKWFYAELMDACRMTDAIYLKRGYLCKKLKLVRFLHVISYWDHHRYLGSSLLACDLLLQGGGQKVRSISSLYKQF